MLDKTNKDSLKLLTPKCPRNHICLEQTDAILGKIDYCVNGKVLFVKSQSENFCPYKYDFGYSHFCTCPLRMQIYLESKKHLNIGVK